MKKSNSEPKGHDTEDSGYSQLNILGISPFLDPIIIKKRTSLDELLLTGQTERQRYLETKPHL